MLRDPHCRVVTEMVAVPAKALLGIQVGQRPGAPIPCSKPVRPWPQAWAPWSPGCPHPQQACGPLSLGASPRGVLVAEGGPEEWEGLPRAQACPLKPLWSGARRYLAPQLVRLLGALSESSWEAKNRGISVGQGLFCCSVSPATLGSGPFPSPLQLRGRAGAPVRSAAVSPPAPSAPGPGWQRGRDAAWDRAGPGGAIQVPTEALASGLAS